MESNDTRRGLHWGTIAAMVLGIAAVLFIVGGYLVSDRMDRTSEAIPGASTGQAHQPEPNTPSDRAGGQQQPGRQGTGTSAVPPASR